MIKAQELRLGNYIGIPNNYLLMPVTKISKNNIEVTTFSGDEKEFSPLPLTKEWLIKFGFKINENGEPEIPTTEGNALSISIRESPYKYAQWLVLTKEFKYYEMGVPILFVHQLQNLYFALTKEELIIVPQPLSL